MEEYRRWEDNIKMDLKEIGVDVMNWMELTQDRDHWRALVNELVNIPIMLCYYGDDMEEYRRWEDNIKMDLKEIGVDVMNWM